MNSVDRADQLRHYYRPDGLKFHVAIVTAWCTTPEVVLKYKCKGGPKAAAAPSAGRSRLGLPRPSTHPGRTPAHRRCSTGSTKQRSRPTRLTPGRTRSTSCRKARRKSGARSAALGAACALPTSATRRAPSSSAWGATSRCAGRAAGSCSMATTTGEEPSELAWRHPIVSHPPDSSLAPLGDPGSQHQVVAAATKPAAGRATRGSLPTILQ